VNIKDPLAGFIGVRRRLITELPMEVPGFKIGLALLAEYGPTIRVCEIPIKFRDRDYGRSKMGRSVILDYFRQLVLLTSRRVRRGNNPPRNTLNS
jgi:dolichol-phosphate mannosyltransferase